MVGCSNSSCYLCSTWSSLPCSWPAEFLGCNLGSFGMLLRATGLSILPGNTAGSQSPRPTEASLMAGVAVWVIFQTTAWPWNLHSHFLNSNWLAGRRIPVLLKLWKHEKGIVCFMNASLWSNSDLTLQHFTSLLKPDTMSSSESGWPQVFL